METREDEGPQGEGVTAVESLACSAIRHRLGDAVKKGEITRAQAEAMMEALKDSTRNEGNDGGEIEEAIGVWGKSIGERIQAAAKAGKISREDAAKRYKDAEKAVRERMAAGRRQR